MTIHGFQKMTLLDFPGRVACTVFTACCNFRCPFCHNALLVTELDSSMAVREEDVLSFLRKRRGLLDGVAVTGGEPCLQPDLADFLRKIRDMGYLVKLDTNGSFPDTLAALIGEGLVDYVAMDIKNSRDKYAQTAGFTHDLLPAVEKSVALLLEGRVDYEFRTTVMNEFHTPEDFDAIGRWIAGAPKYFIQPFKDSGDLICKQPFTTPDRETLDAMCGAVRPYVGSVSVRGAD